MITHLSAKSGLKGKIEREVKLCMMKGFQRFGQASFLAAVVTLSPMAKGESRSEALESAERYLDDSRVVLNQLALMNPDGVVIEGAITQMLEDAKPVMAAYSEVKTQCRNQVARIIELYPEINVWSPTEIRNQIERAQGLPQAQGCYPARDIVAHPAIVRSLVRLGINGDIQQRLIGEMQEAVSHMVEIRELLTNQP